VARCQRALVGEDDEGRKIHPGMFDEGVISFAHGEGMRRPHPAVVAAGVRALLDTEASTLDGYLFLQRLKPLDEAIARFFVAEGIDASTAGNVCVDSGTTRLFLAFLHAVANRGDAFLAAPTYYYPLANWCELAGVRLICVPTRRSHDYKLTREDLEAWHERCGRDSSLRLRGLFLFNPTQTGGIYTRDDLEGIAEFVAAHDLVALEDCIFALTEYEPVDARHHLVGCEGMQDRVVTISGGSKAHGLANIRVGWGCGPKVVIDRMSAFAVTTSATTPQLAKLMALAALEVPREYHRAAAEEARDRAALIMELLPVVNRAASPGDGIGPRREGIIRLEHVPRAGHSILLSFDGMRGLRCPGGTVVDDSIDVTRFFLREAHVALAPGLANGFDGCQMRLCFACVGVGHTYASSHAAELTAAFEELVSCASRAGLDPLRDACLALAAAHLPSTSGRSGFEEGRATIRSAFLDRIAPALHRLVATTAPGELRPAL
jgi:aspartate aminotransferase